MKPKTLLVMLALVLGLGAFIWFFEKDVPSTEERQAQDKKLLGALKPEDVTAVTIVQAGKTVRLERPAKATPAKGETPPERPWKLVQPLTARADRFAVDRLLDSLANLARDRTLDASDRKELGLETPRAKVTLTANGKDTVIAIGSAIPASSNMAAAVDDQPPVVVASYVWNDLAKEPGDWRSKELFPALRDDIERIVLRPAAGEPVTLVEKGEDFRLETPVADRADRDAVSTLLGDLTALQAAAFVDGPPPAGADAWQATVEVQLKGKPEPWRLEIGGAVSGAPAPGAAADAKPAARTLVRADGVLAETESKLADTVRKPAADWRSPRWASFEVFRVEAFDVDDAKGHLELKRQDADWKRGADRIPFTPVSDVLYAVTGARGDKLETRAEALASGANLAQPVLTLKLIAADQSSETLQLYPSFADGGAPAVASGRDDVVVRLNKTFVDDLTSKIQALRAAEPQPVKATEGSGKQD